MKSSHFFEQAVSMPDLLVRSPEDYLHTLLHLMENPLRIQKLRMNLWKSALLVARCGISRKLTRSSELRRRDLALFDNLLIVKEVEVAARIAVDVVVARNCSCCIHVVVSSNAAGAA